LKKADLKKVDLETEDGGRDLDGRGRGLLSGMRECPC
jgi:hypothetical protein